MRPRVNTPQLDPTAMESREVCPYDGCDGAYFTPYEQHCQKPLRNPVIGYFLWSKQGRSRTE